MFVAIEPQRMQHKWVFRCNIIRSFATHGKIKATQFYCGYIHCLQRILCWLQYSNSVATQVKIKTDVIISWPYAQLPATNFTMVATTPNYRNIKLLLSQLHTVVAIGTHSRNHLFHRTISASLLQHTIWLTQHTILVAIRPIYRYELCRWLP
jgi:hypothetical protein